MSVLSDLRTVAVHRDFRKLFTVRLVSQCGDGMFQVGLATLFFFNPQNMATAASVAAAFAVLLLPFTVVGPFAGPLLDRWRRRQVLFLGNALRVVLGLVLAALMATVGVGLPVYVLALVTLGVNRFLLSALSAGLPRVVPADLLLMANTLTPTLGAVSAVVGGALGFVINLLAPAGPVKDGVVLATAALLFGAASLLALRLGRDQLGPAHRSGPGRLWRDVRATAGDMVDGARYLVARRTPGMALGVMAVHRFLYGVNFIALLLMSRNLLSDPADAQAGLATFALLTGVSFAGNGLAIVLTPIAHERMRPSAWIVVCLGIAGVSQALLALSAQRAAIMAAAVLMGLGVQGAKIAVDTIVQRDTDDAYRGRAFALYDVLYNAAFVGAAALAAAVLPDTGWSPAVFAVLTFVYVAVAAAYRAGTGRVHDRPVPVPGTELP
ncbi:MFS transporter [Georgenia thermotolerans]|uniref:MFS transporter n=1 Tax=Georgenia thermotolerans TaxID=527326 RepID=A0A7J5ULV0_9MICO|nr:MFS transporter [Georgenia thermotolerans]KAE8763348.1 MFS transporter [Georgenia thermotolerans]